MIRDATADDAAAIARIYNHYIAHTVITFEEVAVPEEEMRSRIKTTLESHPWYVFERDGRVIGYAYAGTWKGRCAYRHSVETTVYLDPEEGGKGIGTQLYERLLTELESRSYHAVMGGIALPNAASVALHEKLGFTQVASFKELGRKFDRWIDVGYWQRIL